MTDKPSYILSQRLKTLRREKNITQYEMASMFKVTRSCISNWETGKREPEKVVLKELARYFDVSIDYLLGLTEYKKNVDETIENTKQLDLSPLSMRQRIAIKEYYEYLMDKKKDI